MSKIVVSYRRSDSQAIAGRIVDRLIAQFGEQSVFMDVDNIPFGIDFRQHIQSVLAQAEVLIAVVGPDWLGAGTDGGSLIQEEDDPVRVITDELKFAVHVVFYGAAELQNRDRATDKSPLLFFHGESDNYTRIGPTREFADWAQSQGSPVTFVSYPNTYHDFDVQGGFSGLSKSTEVFIKCDMVVDVSAGRVIRLNHVDDPKTTPESVGAYLGSCPGHGANYAFNPAAPANAVEKVHDFLKQYLQIPG